MATALARDIRVASPIATRSEVAALIEVKPQRLTDWSRPRSARPPLVHTVPTRGRFTVPLVGIAEAAALNALRNGGMSMYEARRASDFIRAEFGTEYALASPRLFTDGTTAFVERDGGLWRLRDHQGVLRAVIAAHLRPLILDEDGFVEAFRVEQFTTAEVTIDPRFNAGRMSFAHNRVPVFAVAGLLAAGEKPSDVAEEFRLERPAVEEVVAQLEWLAKVT